jgi:hypothetical protein
MRGKSLFTDDGSDRLCHCPRKYDKTDNSQGMSKEGAKWIIVN